MNSSLPKHSKSIFKLFFKVCFFSKAQKKHIVLCPCGSLYHGRTHTVFFIVEGVLTFQIIWYPRVEDTRVGSVPHSYVLRWRTFVLQMDFSPNPNFIVPHPVLLDGIAECEGFDQASWITKAVTLTNEFGMDVACGICHSVKAELVVDSDGMPLGNDRVAVQIAKLLLEEDVSFEWMFSMRAWHICRVFLNGASLYDHDQRHIYKAAVQVLNR